MPLNINTQNVKDGDTLCYFTPEQDDPEQGLVAGETYMRGLTKTIGFVAMVIALGEITEKNLPEWVARLAIYQQAFGPCLRGPDGKSYCITEADLRAHVGLRLNIAPESRAAFMKNIARCLEEEGRRLMERSAEERRLAEQCVAEEVG
jgi:hypothetical protein